MIGYNAGQPMAIPIYTVLPYCVIATVYLLSDILPLLTTINLVFQREHVNLTAIEPKVNSMVAALKLLKLHPGPHFKKFYQSSRLSLKLFRMTMTSSFYR